MKEAAVPAPLLSWGAQSWTQQGRCGLTSTEQSRKGARGAVSDLGMTKDVFRTLHGQRELHVTPAVGSAGSGHSLAQPVLGAQSGIVEMVSREKLY